MTELRPCPFCGGEARLWHPKEYGITLGSVKCNSCGGSTESFTDDDSAIEAWNNRPSPWHTGTPQEEGLYILLTDFMLDGLSSSGGTYTLDYWDGYAFKYLQKEAEMNAVFKPNKYSWIAWQKIEENEDGCTD